jgi:hypothetical protein
MIEETTTLREGLVKRIHVDQKRIKANHKNGTNLPTMTVQATGGPYKGHRVNINGPSCLQGGDPLSCGARVWIYTTAEVTIEIEEP